MTAPCGMKDCILLHCLHILLHILFKLLAKLLEEFRHSHHHNNSEDCYNDGQDYTEQKDAEEGSRVVSEVLVCRGHCVYDEQDKTDDRNAV